MQLHVYERVSVAPVARYPTGPAPRMWVVVVSGARRNVGKTQLSRALGELLPGACG